jgi:hypothetical protein
MEINQRKCEHAACKCIVSGDAMFCSPYCEKRTDDGNPACDCGHAECQASVADPAAAFAAAGLG